MPVRDATSADAAEIGALIAEHARHEGNETLAPDQAELSKHLFGAEPRAWVLIAEPPGEPGVTAGLAFCWWTLSTWDGRPGIWLDDLFVRPAYRRHGLGRELLGELAGRTTGRVEWDMRDGNHTAEAFYRQLGARPVPGWTRYRWYPS